MPSFKIRRQCECGRMWEDDGPCHYRCVICGKLVYYDNASVDMMDDEMCEPCLERKNNDESD